MIIKILSSSASFSGVRYNTDKIQSGAGELIHVSGFDSLSLLSEHKPSDYINYLKMVSAVNKRISKPQFHAVISTKGNAHSKEHLANVAIGWMGAMGYKDNPYLIIFHGDTDNNHVHIVSTRVDRNGKKISSSFEKLRAIQHLNRLSGIDPVQKASEDINKALGFSFSTTAQFKLILERLGYRTSEEEQSFKLIRYGKVLEEVSLEKISSSMLAGGPDKKQIARLQALFLKYHSKWDRRLQADASGAYSSELTRNIKSRFGVELIFHAKSGMSPYGYTIIDWPGKNIFKGSQVMKISTITTAPVLFEKPLPIAGLRVLDFGLPQLTEKNFQMENFESRAPVLSLTEDIDDEALLGRNRQRKGKARTNTR